MSAKTLIPRSNIVVASSINPCRVEVVTVTVKGKLVLEATLNGERAERR